jgi:hypothetical protein
MFRRVFLSAAAALAGAAMAIPASASAADFTWGGNGNGDAWSIGANWAGGVAPSGTVDALIFPAASCSQAAGCTASNNIAGVTATHLSVAPGPSPYRHSLTGAEALTLTSGLTAELAVIYLPLVLGGPNTWNIAGNSTLIGDPAKSSFVTGNHPLTVNLTTAGSQRAVEFDGAGEVGAATINGTVASPIAASPITFGRASGGEGVIFAGTPSGLNGTNGNPVAVNAGVSLSGTGTFGPLTLSNSILHPGPTNVGSSSPQAGAIAVNGALTLDADSVFENDFLNTDTASPIAGTHYPTVTATGNVTLNSAHLVLDSCSGGTVGATAFTLVSTTGGAIVGTFDDMAGNPLADGALIRTTSQQPTCPGGLERWLRINYTSTAATATLVAPPAVKVTVTSSAAVKAVDDSDLFSVSFDQPYNGTATFTLNGTKLCDLPVYNGVPASAGCGVGRYMDAGAATVVVAFSPTDASGSPGTGELSFLVAKNTTTISDPGASPNAIGSPMQLTALVSSSTKGGTTRQTGTVTFFSGSTPLPGCTDVPLGPVGAPGTSGTSARASCEAVKTCRFMPVRAVYSGDANYAGSSSPLTAEATGCGEGFGPFPDTTPSPEAMRQALAAFRARTELAYATALDKAKSTVKNLMRKAGVKQFTVAVPTKEASLRKLERVVTLKDKRSGVVVASGRAKAGSADKVTVKLTVAGRKLLRQAAKRRRALTMTLTISFTDTPSPDDARAPKGDKLTIKVLPPAGK